MFDSAIIDVAIGLAFIFLLVSLLVTAVSEALAGWLKWRSVHLWDGLEHLLQSAQARDALFTHPLIKGLARVNPAAPDWANGKNAPSYIPSRTFALALIDILRRPHKVADDIEQRLIAAVKDATDPVKAFAALEAVVKEVSASDASEAVKQSLRTLQARAFPPVDAAEVNKLKTAVQQAIELVPEAERTAAAASLAKWLEQEANNAATYVGLRSTLQAAINAVPFAGLESPTEQLRTTLNGVLGNFAHGRPEDALREIQAFAKGAARRWLDGASAELQGTVQALQPLLHDAADDIDRFRENVEIWFNNGMDRVSGWYKRHISVVHAVIAGVMAFALNIDALQITRTLWREPTLRQSLVANATNFVNEREAEVVDPSSESVLEIPDVKLKITADKVRLFPDEIAKFIISPEPADAAKPIPADKEVKVTVDRQAPNVLLSKTAGDFALNPVELVSGNRSAEFYVKALPISSTTAARVKVAADGREVSPQLVLTPQGDVRFAAMREEIGTLGLPIGWGCPQEAKLTAEPTSIGGPFWCSSPPGRSGHRWLSLSWWMTWFLEIMAMVLGWVITAAAASLGAPFWFDLLKRFVSIRAGGKAPEERGLKPKEVPLPLEPGQRPREADLLDALRR